MSYSWWHFFSHPLPLDDTESITVLCATERINMIDFTPFIQRLNLTKPLPNHIASEIMSGLRINRFEAQETILSPGNFPGAIYYIQSGVVRGAIEGINEKSTTWFKQDGGLIIPQGAFNQQVSEEYISTIAKTIVVALPVKHIEKVIALHPELQQLFILLLNENVLEGQYRERLLRISAARDRYDYLAKHEGFILKRVPHYLIASYLNVTKETFSRLHKGLAY